MYDLGFRAKISLTGGDRVRWLNGMVTNNIRDLAVDQGVYAFLLNPQGHILGDLYAYNRGESITIDTDRGQEEKILATFDHYIIMDDVEVTNLSEQLTALGIAGPKSREVLAAVGFAIAEMQALQVQSVMWQGTECTLVRGEECGVCLVSDMGCAGERAATLGRFAGRWGCGRGVRGVGAAAHCLWRSALWCGHPRARLAAGNGAGARFELQ